LQADQLLRERSHPIDVCAVPPTSIRTWEEIIPDDHQSPEALRALQETHIKKLWPLIKEFGIKAE
jgi:hypothetical protein